MISETKLDSSFSSAQFLIGGYETTNCRDRDKSWGGLIEFFKKGIITNRLKDLETNIRKTIYTEITVSKKRWYVCIFSFFLIWLCLYRPPFSSNIDTFDELTISLSKAVK